MNINSREDRKDFFLKGKILQAVATVELNLGAIKANYFFSAGCHQEKINHNTKLMYNSKTTGNRNRWGEMF